MQGKEKHGPDHTSTLDTVNNLGNLYISGKLDEAEKIVPAGHCWHTVKVAQVVDVSSVDVLSGPMLLLSLRAAGTLLGLVQLAPTRVENAQVVDRCQC